MVSGAVAGEKYYHYDDNACGHVVAFQAIDFDERKCHIYATTISKFGKGGVMEYSIKQSAVLLGVKVRTVRQWIRDSKIVGRKDPISMRWHIPESEIQRKRGDKNADKD